MLERLRNLDVMVDHLDLAAGLHDVQGAPERCLGLDPVAVDARDLDDARLPDIGAVDLGRGAVQIVTDPRQQGRQDATLLFQRVNASQTEVDS